jgi:VanZ family protein
MKKIIYWVPPLFVMLLIFRLSSQPRFTATGEPLEDFLIFKLLHMCEYGLLAALLFNALYNTFVQKLLPAIRYAGIIAILYAMTDEFHQVFVPTRSGTIRDVGIDGLGIFIMLYLISKTMRSQKARK